MVIMMTDAEQNLELVQQVRTLANAFGSHYNDYKKHLETDGDTLPWLVRHTGWLIRVFLWSKTA